MPRVKFLTAITILGIAALLMTGCSSPAKPLTTGPDFYGFITQVNTIDSKDVVGSIAVESHADKIVDKYVVTVTEDTAIFRLDGDNYLGISFDDLEDRQWLQIWFDGPVMESWPMQAKALQILITQ